MAADLGGSVSAMSERAPQVPPNCDLTLGMVCVDKSQPGRSVWRATAHEKLANPSGVVQGGFLAAYCDSAMGAAVVTFAAGRKVRLASTELTISFFRPVPAGTVLTCEAVVVSGGVRVAFAEATLTSEGAGVVARASSTYLLSGRD